MTHSHRLLLGLCSWLLLALVGCATVKGPAHLPAPCAALDPRALLGACAHRLDPGEEIVLRLEPWTDVTLRADRALTPDDLVVGLSNGSGVVVHPQLEARDGALHLAGTGRGSVAALRIARPPGSSRPLFVTVLANDPARLPGELAAGPVIPGKALRVNTTVGGRGRSYDILRPAMPVAVAVTGPVQLTLRSRLLIADGVDWTRSYRLSATLDGAPFGVLEEEASPDLSAWLDAPNAHLSVGAVQSATLDIPTGPHTLELVATRDLLLTLDKQPTQTFRTRDSLWQLPAPARQSLTAQACTLPEVQETAARRMARDNRFSGGGLVAADTLAQIAAARPEDAAQRSAARHIKSAYTFYRDLVPLSPPGLAQHIGYVANPGLADLQEATPAVPGGLPTSLLLNRLIRAVFVALPPGGLGYALPPREADSEVRLVVDKGAMTAPTDVFVRFDGGAVQRVRVVPGRDFPPFADQTDAGLAGLARVAQATGVGLASASKTGLFAQHRDPARLADGGTAELPLPQGVRQVQVWSTAPNGLRVGLQYRAAVTDRLDEAGYAGDVARLGPDRARALFGTALAAALNCGSWLTNPGGCAGAGRIMAAGSLPERELLNDWMPLLRLLRARERALFATLPPDLRLHPSSGVEVPDLTGAKASALAAEGRGDWQVALAEWSAVARAAQGADWGRAVLGQSEALVQLGEFFLAERMLKAAYLAAPEAASRETAFTRMQALFTARDAQASLTGLAAAEAVRAPGPARLRALAAALVAEGANDDAARLLLLLPASGDAVALTAAYRAGWDRTLRRALSQAGPVQAALWTGLMAQRGGDSAGARRIFQQVGVAGQGWLAALDRAQADPVAVGIMTDPGPGRWQNAEAAIRASAGGVTFVTPSQALYGRLYRATSAQPVVIEVTGPTRLRIAARPLHRNREAGPLDGWLRIRADGRDLNVPVTGNFPALGIRFFGMREAAGTAVQETLTLSEGRHRIEVMPWSGAVLVSAEIEVPVQATSRSHLASAGNLSANPMVLTPAQDLAQLLRVFETNAARRDMVLAEAAGLAQRHRKDPAVADVWNRFDRQSAWERVASVDSSAGQRSLPVPVYAPESPELRTRLAMLPPLLPGEKLVQRQDTLAVRLVNAAPTIVQAKVSLDSLPTLPIDPIELRYWLDEADPVVLLLDADPQNVQIAVPEGSHVLRFSTPDRQANQFVRLRLQDEDGTVIGQDDTRSYDVATAAEPVRLTLQGPAWLRISERRGDRTLDYTRLVPEGQQTLVLSPEAGQAQALFRVFRLVPTVDPPAPVQRLEVPQEQVPMVPNSRASLPRCLP